MEWKSKTDYLALSFCSPELEYRYSHYPPELEPMAPELRDVRAANAVRAAISDGAYQPGERLPRQHDLAREHNVAFTTLK